MSDPLGQGDLNLPFGRQRARGTAAGPIARTSRTAHIDLSDFATKDDFAAAGQAGEMAQRQMSEPAAEHRPAADPGGQHRIAAGPSIDNVGGPGAGGPSVAVERDWRELAALHDMVTRGHRGESSDHLRQRGRGVVAAIRWPDPGRWIGGTASGAWRIGMAVPKNIRHATRRAHWRATLGAARRWRELRRAVSRTRAPPRRPRPPFRLDLFDAILLVVAAAAAVVYFGPFSDNLVASLIKQVSGSIALRLAPVVAPLAANSSAVQPNREAPPAAAEATPLLLPAGTALSVGAEPGAAGQDAGACGQQGSNLEPEARYSACWPAGVNGGALAFPVTDKTSISPGTFADQLQSSAGTVPVDISAAARRRHGSTEHR